MPNTVIIVLGAILGELASVLVGLGTYVLGAGGEKGE